MKNSDTNLGYGCGLRQKEGTNNIKKGIPSTCANPITHRSIKVGRFFLNVLSVPDSKAEITFSANRVVFIIDQKNVHWHWRDEYLRPHKHLLHFQFLNEARLQSQIANGHD